MGEEIPKYLRVSHEVEPWRLYLHEKMQKETLLFEEVFAELDKKIKDGGFFLGKFSDSFFDRDRLKIYHLESEERQQKQVSKERYFLTIGPMEAYFMKQAFVCIFLQRMWNPEHRKYDYTYAMRKIKFEPRKLEETALPIFEQNPPDERKWFEEDGIETEDSLNMKIVLGTLLSDIRSLRPLPQLQDLYKED